jgi:hypothetical protein
MTGKLIEIGDLECLEGAPDNQRSGVVIQIDREQLKASRNLFSEQVEVVACGEYYWNKEKVGKLRAALKLCVARLEEYPDAEGGTTLTLARQTLNET